MISLTIWGSRGVDQMFGWCAWTVWLVSIVALFSVNPNSEAQSLGEPVVVWRFEKGPLPVRADIEALNQAYMRLGDPPDLRAWLGLLNFNGVPGLYGRHRELGDSLLDASVADGQADALLHRLGEAIQSRDSTVIRQLMDALNRDELDARQRETLRVYEQLAVIAGKIEGDSAIAVQALNDWFRNEGSVQAGIGLFVARAIYRTDIGLPNRSLAEELDSRSPRTAWVLRSMLDLTVAIRSRDADSIQTGLNSLRRAAELGNDFAIKQLAFELWDGSDLLEQDREEAIYWLMHQVFMEDGRAAVLLAQAWLTGEGCERNDEAAATLLLRYGTGEYRDLWEGPDADAIQEALAKGPPYRASSEEGEPTAE